jgi:hypothetical protein
MTYANPEGRSSLIPYLIIDTERHYCLCGALCERASAHCRKCRARSRWYRRKAWRVNPERHNGPVATTRKGAINR